MRIDQSQQSHHHRIAAKPKQDEDAANGAASFVLPQDGSDEPDASSGSTAEQAPDGGLGASASSLLSSNLWAGLSSASQETQADDATETTEAGFAASSSGMSASTMLLNALAKQQLGAGTSEESESLAVSLG